MEPESPPRVGDRVRIQPESAQFKHLRGEVGTVEAIYEGWPIDGSLLVRLDCDGKTIGVGAHSIARVEHA